uniref:Cytochrome c oxidase subunit 3 n=1 Tax=Blattisocius tarsalis TaxID=1609195 RepID=A0A6B9WCU0_9ACAR|nr:cytochrome c oxidase subunit III [Blattisocius tarsalis]QHQ98569.1 cytochrome oxidase subunit 3 [Blattisocius tarsalis]
MLKKFHFFHILDNSPWPLLISFNGLNSMTSFLLFLTTHNLYSKLLSIFNMIMLLTCATLWWRDVLRESYLQGHHTYKVMSIMKMGMALFIISEIMLFSSFFWSYFYSCLAPEPEVGMIWPPNGILPLNPFEIPLLNTLILLGSGATVTWSHFAFITSNYKTSFMTLKLTIALGMIFTILQYMEYNMSLFNINDSVYSSLFYMITGLHGTHVIIGAMFMLFNLYRMYFSQMNLNHHFSLEASIWYWHFVDIIWLYLYTFMYWWHF